MSEEGTAAIDGDGIETAKGSTESATTTSTLEVEPSVSRTSSSHETVTEEIQAAFSKWNEAWNKGDLEGYLDAYWDSPDTRYVSESLKPVPGVPGIVVLGKKEIDKVFTDVFIQSKRFLENQLSKKGVAGLVSLVQLDVTPAGTTDAVAFGQYRLELTDTVTRGGVFTIHLRKVKDKWKIVYEHSTPLPKETSQES
jgi:ketosteroid isomerase-like protein